MRFVVATASHPGHATTAGSSAHPRKGTGARTMSTTTPSVQSLLSQRDAQAAHVAALQAQLDAAKAALKATTDALAAHKEPLQSEYDAIGAQIDENVAMRQELKAERRVFREQCAAAPTKAKKAKAQQRISDNTSYEYELEEKCKELRAARAAIKARLDSFKKPAAKKTAKKAA